jgi:hypothetical protein
LQFAPLVCSSCWWWHAIALVSAVVASGWHTCVIVCMLVRSAGAFAPCGRVASPIHWGVGGHHCCGGFASWWCAGVVLALWAFTPCGGLPAGHWQGSLVPALGGCTTAVVAALCCCGTLWPSWCCVHLRCIGTFVPVQAVDGAAPLASLVRRWWWCTIATVVLSWWRALAVSALCACTLCQGRYPYVRC